MGGEGRVRYRHLRRTVIAVLATVAFVLLFGLLIRAILEAEPTRRMAVRWIERVAGGYGAQLEIDDLHWGILPPGVRLRGVSFRAAGITAEVDTLQVDLGRVWLARRTVELGTVAASGVRLSLDGLPRSSGGSRRPFKIRVRHLELDDGYSGWLGHRERRSQRVYRGCRRPGPNRQDGTDRCCHPGALRPLR